LAGFLLLLAALPGRLDAHESRPAYLEISETSPGRYALLWRTPVLQGMALPVALTLPEGIETIGEPITQRLSDSLLERRLIGTGNADLAGQRIDFAGLQATITDVLVRVRYAGGGQTTMLVHPQQAWVEIPAPQGWFSVLASYTRHGIDHILFGYDHLLFVLALVFIVRSTSTLIWTLTSFTLAHSITLALATLGVVRVPGPPVEAAIALSIVLLAYEILRAWRGDQSATASWPWVVAFVFGLLHGFGFAGALAELGLPREAIPLALFAFNVGVELGQLMFIVVVMGLIALARRVSIPVPLQRVALPVVVYVIGGLASFWFFERLTQFIW
jgi:hydrogenase/urease accessory protein HupE